MTNSTTEQPQYTITVNVEGEMGYILIPCATMKELNEELHRAQLMIGNRPPDQQGDVLVQLGSYYIPARRIIWIRIY
jgi:hypothetical protein